MSYNQQPAANPGMTVTGGNRNVKNLPIDAAGRDWSHGLFECLDDPVNFVFACFLPCVVYGQNVSRYEHLTNNGTPDPERGANLINNHCITHGVLHSCCAAGWVLQFLKRGPIRERYSVRGAPAEDFVTACCCGPCGLVQESREIELEEQSFGKQG